MCVLPTQFHYAVQDFAEVYAGNPFDIVVDCLPGECQLQLLLASSDMHAIRDLGLSPMLPYIYPYYVYIVGHDSYDELLTA